MIHGTHYQAISRDVFADNKVWGPWLWYLNSGSKTDAAARASQEESAWPYKWYNDKAYQSRGKVQGRLLLSDGRPASNAAVFLGDNNNSSISTLDQGKDYYYTSYTDAAGRFSFKNVRTGAYALQAWSNGGALYDVLTNYTHNDVTIRKGDTTNLKDLTWKISDKSKRIFQIGALDRKTDGFGLADPNKPFEHGRISRAPANLTFTVGVSQDKDWYFGQSALGTWSINFPSAVSTAAKLTVSLAGFSQGSSCDILLNDVKIGNITSASLVNSQDTYRGATRNGEWRLLEFPVAGGLLKGNATNRLDVRVTRSTQWRGWLWDSVVLEAV
jgi:rhamnogalacturonan endolyase